MRRVLVTGASKGIGQATAMMLGKAGFFVCVHYHRDQNGAKETLRVIEGNGGQGALIQFDISDRDQCQNVLSQDIKENGAFYGVVSNAGICKDVAFPAMLDEQWDQVIHTNLDGFYNVLKPCVLPMVQARKGGRIVSLASVSGIAGNKGQVNYSAAKAGIIGATKALALELAKRKITVNCVAPGLIETDMTKDLEYKEEMQKYIPMRRMGKVDEVASLINYLFSDQASYLTRQVISVNGGLL
ncbi:3-ketoacyl-ACP reductase FabG2 [Facilibium subflavum]|uniref:3-ketoacyl-ACP reductase FabG2 n=1 Tax=Facilibium subflavum TaxID=2219058 RepID=UPI000E652C01|nr:3-ketoacyl-ACP reductase FabG2 [Facilibium subflavum]